MRQTLNRYLPARIICFIIRSLGYYLMLYPDHFGHQAGDVEYDLRTKPRKLIYLVGVIPNRALYEMHRRYATVIRVPDWMRTHLVEAHIAYACLDEALSRDLTYFGNTEVWSSKPQLEFSEEEREYGEALLNELGLVAGEYVCFHARDPMYATLHHPEVLERRKSKHLESLVEMTEAHPFQGHRNVDFSLYFPTIDWLGTRGLKAVRLGSDVERPYCHGNLIDYASARGSFENPDLADLYLMAKSKLYVGHATGVSHLSMVWNTPAVAVNWFPFTPGSRPSANFKACRVKKLKVHGEVLSEFHTRHFFELANWLQIYAASSEFETIENTPQEILDTVQKAL